MWHVYFRGGKFLLPTTCRTEAGFFLDSDPIAVVASNDASKLASALDETIRRGNPTTPTPTRAAFPKPAVLNPAGVASWSTFEKKSICWTITDDGNDYAIEATGRSPSGGWQDDPTTRRRVPRADGATALVATIVQELSQRADV